MLRRRPDAGVQTLRCETLLSISNITALKRPRPTLAEVNASHVKPANPKRYGQHSGGCAGPRLLAPWQSRCGCPSVQGQAPVQPETRHLPRVRPHRAPRSGHPVRRRRGRPRPDRLTQHAQRPYRQQSRAGRLPGRPEVRQTRSHSGLPDRCTGQIAAVLHRLQPLPAPARRCL